MLTCTCYVPPLLYNPSEGNITGYVSNFYLHNQNKMVWLTPTMGLTPLYWQKKCCIALCVLYNKLYKLKTCCIWHPKTGFVSFRGIHKVIYYRLFELYNLTCYVIRNTLYNMLYSIFTKDLIFPYITCNITSKWLYNLVRNICCRGPDYVWYLPCYIGTKTKVHRVQVLLYRFHVI